jgi:hypothetical protein
MASKYLASLCVMTTQVMPKLASLHTASLQVMPTQVMTILFFRCVKKDEKMKWYRCQCAFQ